MIAFKDFTAGRDDWFAGHTMIDDVIHLMNEWLADNPVHVINVETLTVGKRRSFHGVRVWYQRPL